MISSWSFSRLSDFEACKYRAYLKYDLRVPEPIRPLPTGKTEHANDRGTRIHTAAEEYVNGTRDDLIAELRTFEPEINHLRALYKDGIVSMEHEWGVDHDWNVAEWTKAWHRSKLDVFVQTSEHEGMVIDYKTGRKFGNEMKHGQQLQLYAVNAFARFPFLERVTTELWYTDQDDITSMTFTRAQSLRFKPNFHRRGEAVTAATEFPPNPNIHSCKWCMYGESGDCKVSAKQMFKGVGISQA